MSTIALMATPAQIQHSVEIVHNGGVIAYATEAVYGLGCDPQSEEATKRILAIKQRPLAKGLILIASQMEHIQPYLGKLSKKEQLAMQSVWPGPVTLILPCSDFAPHWLTGGRDTIAVRITAHQDVRVLCDALGHGLVSTSANLAGCPSIVDESELHEQFGTAIDHIHPSTLGGNDQPSRIIDVRNDRQLR